MNKIAKNQQNLDLSLSNKFSTIKTIKEDLKDDHLIKIMDKALKHLNQISEANTIIQDLYIELVKQKKIMKYDQIRKIYKILTEGKAKQILFQREKEEIKTKDYESHQGLIRICWRSIQKLVQKITYYMVNQSNLSIISKNVLKLIKLHQNFMRRFKQIKNSSMLYIIEVIQHLLIENSILQKKIYEILLNRGYVVSLDEFYNLNGIGADHNDNYYAKQNNQIDEAQQQQSEKQSPAKQQTNQKNSRNNIRKKKVFRLDCRYSWKNKQFEQNYLDQTYPSNKTNYQIRQSFQKFMGDIFQNDNFIEVLKKINLQQSQQKQEEDSSAHQIQETSMKYKQSISSPNMEDQKNLHKKIFENKIESVLNRLKSNSITVKPSAKLLSIIDNAVNKAVSNKLSFIQKKSLQRKNSIRGENAGNNNLINHQKKRKQSSTLITDRKIVNQNFFRELLRQNSNYQSFVQNQIIKSSQIFDKSYVQRVSLTQKNFSSKILDKHNSDLTKNKLRNKMLNLRNQNINSIINKNVVSPVQNNLVQTNISKIDKNHSKTDKKLQFNIRNMSGSTKNNTETDMFSQIIRMSKQQWQLNQQKKILKALQYLSLIQNQPNKLKLRLNDKNPFYSNNKQNHYQQIFKKSHFYELKPKKQINEISYSHSTNFSKRIKTQFDQQNYYNNKIQYQENMKIKSFRQKINLVPQSQRMKIKMKNKRKNTQSFNQTISNFKFRIYDRRRMRIIQ